MSEDKSTPAVPTDKTAKPAKPRPDFPLGIHPAGYWCKKIRGKLHYFGPRFDPKDAAAATAAADEALKDYNRQAEALRPCPSRQHHPARPQRLQVRVRR